MQRHIKTPPGHGVLQRSFIDGKGWTNPVKFWQSSIANVDAPPAPPISCVYLAHLIATGIVAIAIVVGVVGPDAKTERETPTIAITTTTIPTAHAVSTAVCAAAIAYITAHRAAVAARCKASAHTGAGTA